ncbi:MAG: SpoIID/LytB domain-containing protein, partial [Lutimaribacter sp.]
AVAARSYALAHMARPASRHWHLGDTPRWQAYKGLASSHSRTREYRGIALHQEDGVSFLVARQDGRTSSFNFLTPVAADNRPLLEGYSARTTRPPTQGQRLSRLVYEYIGGFGPAVLAAARSSGFCSLATLPAPHRRHLQPNTPLS